jgi:hypothetical protein
MTLERTDCTRITSRVSETTIGRGSPLRDSVSTTVVLGLPRMSLTASLSGMPLVGFSSILMIRSPALTPARNAGVSSIGETTLTKPSSVPTSMPRPPNSPWVPTCSSLNASASRNAECGSRPVTMPLIASLISFLSSTGST